MNWKQAHKIANKYLYLLGPHCEKAHIAGSIRREQAEVKDIEIVCIPKRELVCSTTDLFGNDNDATWQPVRAFCDVVNSLPKVKGLATGKYTRRLLPEGIQLDLFMVNRENWGAQLLIRTGSARFSKWVIGTLLPQQGYRMEDGYVMKGQHVVPVYEEEDVLNLLNDKYFTRRFINPTTRGL